MCGVDTQTDRKARSKLSPNFDLIFETHRARKGVSTTPVSYTHLDVYKRQDQVDSHGRRNLVEVEEEQRGIRRIRELYEEDVYVRRICEFLDAEGITCRGKPWHRRTVARVLERTGVVDPDRPRKSAPSKIERHAATPDAVRDKKVVAVRAVELRKHGLSLRQIASTLHSERLLPQRGDIWYAAGVMDLLRVSAEAQKSMPKRVKSRR